MHSNRQLCWCRWTPSVMRMIRLLYVEAGRGRRGRGVKKSLADLALQKVEDFLLHVVSAECTVFLPPPLLSPSLCNANTHVPVNTLQGLANPRMLVEGDEIKGCSAELAGALIRKREINKELFSSLNTYSCLYSILWVSACLKCEKGISVFFFLVNK